MRTLAILGMMAAHASRLIEFEVRESWSFWVLRLEPLIPSLFLFLVGVSLTFSLAKAEGGSAWYFRQARRAGMLWLISAVFFTLELGLRPPDFFLASGILCTIAYSILILGAALLSPGPQWTLGLFLGIGSSAFVLLDASKSRAFPFLTGNSPLFPLLLFAVAGALWGIFLRRKPGIAITAAIPALLFAAWAVHRYGLETLFTRPFGRSDATRLLAPPLTGGKALNVGYYNLRPLLSLVCLAVAAGITGLASLLLSGVKEAWSRSLFLLGRYSLEAYVLHLFLLALLVVTLGEKPLKTALQGNLVLLGVVAVCWSWAIFREKHIKLRQRQKKS